VGVLQRREVWAVLKDRGRLLFAFGTFEEREVTWRRVGADEGMGVRLREIVVYRAKKISRRCQDLAEERAENISRKGAKLAKER
jgi:hypothetical protein